MTMVDGKTIDELKAHIKKLEMEIEELKTEQQVIKKVFESDGFKKLLSQLSLSDHIKE